MAGSQNDLTPTYSGRGRGLTPYSEPSGFLAPSDFFTASPWQLMRRMQEDMERMMGQFMSPTSISGQLQQQMWQPNVDVSEAIKHWQIEVDLPGVDKNDIDVEINDRQLTVKAKMRQQSEQAPEGDRRYYRRERRSGYFERTFPLPDNVDEDHISCNFNNGVLNIFVPKMEQSQSTGRHIEIAEQQAGQQQGAQQQAGQQQTDTGTGQTGL
jgi:HSP20 family protein